MKLVEALDTYKRLNVKDKELDRIPKVGERFNITEERLEVLLGNNPQNAVFVKIVDEEQIIKSDGDSEATQEVSEEAVQEVEAIAEESDKEEKKNKNSKK